MKITVNKNAKTIPTNFSWQFGVGNDHAFQLHRKDVCDHVKLVHDELGMKYIRFHGVFDTICSVFSGSRITSLLPLCRFQTI